MPLPDPDLGSPAQTQSVSIALEPAQNALYSLVLLSKVDSVSGLDAWVLRTATSLHQEQRHTNRLVSFGLFYTIVPDRSWPSFKAHLDHLAAQEPAALRDRVLNAYAQLGPKTDDYPPLPDPMDCSAPVDKATLLGSTDAFLEHLLERFHSDCIDLEIESEAHRYLRDPPALKALVVSHLRTMWEEHLSLEWARVLPKLETCQRAFSDLDLEGLSRLEAARRILGRNLDESWWEAELERSQRVVFVPSAHLGPYLGKFRSAGTMWVLFGARLPDGTSVHAPDLSRAEILTRMDALADDTRLRILRLLGEQGEQCSGDIMAKLGLSQSATSRHLKQLSATGYLIERRCNGAKCYSLSSDRLESTLRAITAFVRAR